MTRIHIQFSLFSAFYSPLIATMAGGFLAEEGLEADWSVSPPGVSAIAALRDGSAHVVQSALSQAFGPLSKGEAPGVVHFAQINEMDGFFLTGRDPDPDFDWRRLEGAEVVLFGGGQPLAMFRYACHKAGIDYDRIEAIHPGGAADIDRAFRDGEGAYVQQQGPFPQQLEADGVGHVVAEVGRQVGLCGFSS
ncbi:MAG: ABC transporter substrate-binding protein, partial [Rhodospirillaceae bacterium]|nr:ABC transporter substrate-binding protein [Rhodospirillaceae bacterium]